MFFQIWIFSDIETTNCTRGSLNVKMLSYQQMYIYDKVKTVSQACYKMEIPKTVFMLKRAL